MDCAWELLVVVTLPRLSFDSSAIREAADYRQNKYHEAVGNIQTAVKYALREQTALTEKRYEVRLSRQST